jgi:hypothetical protein
MRQRAALGNKSDESTRELDTIVADYFEMLEAELSGRPYVKSRHSKALMARMGRTHRSVEFLHQLETSLSCRHDRKKANSVRSIVGTSTVRSRYRLPRSHEVSGKKRHP